MKKLHRLKWFNLIILSLLFLGVVLSGCGAEGQENSGATETPPRVTATLPVARKTPVPVNTPLPTFDPQLNLFDGDAAYQLLEEQMKFGPRWPGSPGHQEVGNYIVKQLRDLDWIVEEQRFTYQDIEGRNIIGRVNEGAGPVIILGAHYDSRKIADQTPGSIEPVPGAVDGASGVAVLLELARTLDVEAIKREVWLAFFDVEDNGSGGIPGFDWIVGSTYMANNLEIMPEAMVLVDMIGDSDQQLYYEGNSDPELQSHLWKIALDLDYGDVFIPEYRHTMIDDHLPFARRGIPAVDIIDFDYPYWHTVEDIADKASPQSLARVGRTLENWLESRLNR
ncbi:MAG TPA: M28 family peptidase [Patescibacteria group bacterium]|nr:M28 family peptidase [Patescibacteria group bacterium]